MDNRRQEYRLLRQRQEQLKEKKANSDLHLLIWAKHPDLSDTDLIAQERIDNDTFILELDAVTREMNALEKHDDVRFMLARELGIDIDPSPIQTIASVEEKPVNWLWYPYIPLGKITMLEGDPGQGKTWFSLCLASCTTHGGWYTGGDENYLTPSNVLYLHCEDDVEDTVKARVRIMQADESRVYVFRDSPQRFLVSDIKKLEAIISETDAKLIMIDPIFAFLPAKINPNHGPEVRPLLMQLKDLAKRRGCAILLIRHLSKGEKTQVMYKGSGAIEWTAAARSVLYAAKAWNEQRKQELFYISQLKNSLTKVGNTLVFSLEYGQYLWVGHTPQAIEQLVKAPTVH